MSERTGQGKGLSKDEVPGGDQLCSGAPSAPHIGSFLEASSYIISQSLAGGCGDMAAGGCNLIKEGSATEAQVTLWRREH